MDSLSSHYEPLSYYQEPLSYYQEPLSSYKDTFKNDKDKLIYFKKPVEKMENDLVSLKGMTIYVLLICCFVVLTSVIMTHMLKRAQYFGYEILEYINYMAIIIFSIMFIYMFFIAYIPDTTVEIKHEFMIYCIIGLVIFLITIVMLLDFIINKESSMILKYIN